MQCLKCGARKDNWAQEYCRQCGTLFGDAILLDAAGGAGCAALGLLLLFAGKSAFAALLLVTVGVSLFLRLFTQLRKARQLRNAGGKEAGR